MFGPDAFKGAGQAALWLLTIAFIVVFFSGMICNKVISSIPYRVQIVTTKTAN